MEFFRDRTNRRNMYYKGEFVKLTYTTLEMLFSPQSWSPQQSQPGAEGLEDSWRVTSVQFVLEEGWRSLSLTSEKDSGSRAKHWLQTKGRQAANTAFPLGFFVLAHLLEGSHSCRVRPLWKHLSEIKSGSSFPNGPWASLSPVTNEHKTIDSCWYLLV